MKQEEIDEYIQSSREVKPPFYETEWKLLKKILDDHLHSGKEVPHIDNGSFWNNRKICPPCNNEMVKIKAYWDKKTEANHVVYHCKKCGFSMPFRQKDGYGEVLG